MSALADILRIGGVAVVFVAVVAGLLRRECRINLDATGCIGNLMCATGNILARSWLFAAANLAAAVFCGWMWFNRRRRRKRVLRTLGNKAKARLAALVRKSREAPRPRPVLRPVPGGIS